MNPLSEQMIACPYCGEQISVLLDSSEAWQEYIEDCQVCCRPIVFNLQLDESGEPLAHVRTEDDTY